MYSCMCVQYAYLHHVMIAHACMLYLQMLHVYLCVYMCVYLRVHTCIHACIHACTLVLLQALYMYMYTCINRNRA